VYLYMCIEVEQVYSVCMTVNFMDPKKALEKHPSVFFPFKAVQLCTVVFSVYMMEKHLIGTQVYCCRV